MRSAVRVAGLGFASFAFVACPSTPSGCSRVMKIRTASVGASKSVCWGPRERNLT